MVNELGTASTAGGDRHLNRALHHITLTRLATDPVTRDYVNRRVAQGKTPREARRCLKRYLARRLWRVLEHRHAPAPMP